MASSQASMGWLDRVFQAFGAEPRDKEQLIELLKDAKNRSLLDTDALAMIEGALEVSELRVRDIMIPRAQTVVVGRDDPMDKILPVVTGSAHSRFPVIGDDKGEVIGILLAKDLLHQLQSNGGDALPWATLLRPAVFIPESKRLNVLLQEFRDSRNHMAIVVDEYGGVVGLITIEDVLEQIVGNIEDEHDVDGAVGMVLRRGSDFCVIKAMLPIDSFNHLFGLNLNPLEYDTMGGLVTGALGHVPHRGETIKVEGITAEVLSADSRRPRLLRITDLPPSD